jgi:hypothetical protein
VIGQKEMIKCVSPPDQAHAPITAYPFSLYTTLAWAYRNLMGKKEKAKTYNSGYSLVVTHLTTNPPVRCLNRAERTGSLVFNVLWSYVKDFTIISYNNAKMHCSALYMGMRTESLPLGFSLTPTRQAQTQSNSLRS